MRRAVPETTPRLAQQLRCVQQSERAVGVVHFCLLVDDVVETARRLHGPGVTTDEPRKGRRCRLQSLLSEPDGQRDERRETRPAPVTPPGPGVARTAGRKPA